MTTHRDTRTGSVLEKMVLPALDCGGYTVQSQVVVGQRLGCGAHKIDFIAEKDGRKVLISLKWQQSVGTVEQKVPFEVICLADALTRGYDAAYLVLGGEGMTAKLRQVYVNGGLQPFLNVPWVRLHIVTFESFIARANQGKI
jgi:hypothetical protein